MLSCFWACGFPSFVPVALLLAECHRNVSNFSYCLTASTMCFVDQVQPSTRLYPSSRGLVLASPFLRFNDPVACMRSPCPVRAAPVTREIRGSRSLVPPPANPPAHGRLGNPAPYRADRPVRRSERADHRIGTLREGRDRKSTRLNSSHQKISY